MTQAASGPSELEKRLGYPFQDPNLLEEALTHASCQDDPHNERLEFLGDAVLNLVVAEELFRRFPHSREGRLTELKSRIVARQTLAEVGIRLGLEPFLRTGGSLEGRPSLPRSLVGNAVEALLGAIYLDAAQRGMNQAGRAVLRWLAPELDAVSEERRWANAKQNLQSYAQKQCGGLPKYQVKSTYEHPDATSFMVEAEVAGRCFPAAWGSSKKEAERWAAWEALLVLASEGAVELD
ncbi:MAG: ribonuclease III [Planctomycetota bacterium]|nr:MAG: ribonuclease III [Planctomycetota bacterium]